MAGIGIDFGTTNSSIALATGRRDVKVSRFSEFGKLTENFRSLLYLSVDERLSDGEASPFAGPAGIEQYLWEGGTGRLMQSLKSFLGSGSFTRTQVLQTRYELVDLISLILAELRLQAEWSFGDLGRRRPRDRARVIRASEPDHPAVVDCGRDRR